MKKWRDAKTIKNTFLIHIVKFQNMKNLKKLLDIVKSFSEIAIIASVMLILGISLWTNTPILELTGLDSQWWILFLCLLTYVKVNHGDDVK